MTQNPDRIRVLILTGTPKDGLISCDLLLHAGIESQICRNIEELCTRIKEGAGALLLSEEVLLNPSVLCLTDLLKQQPPWSNLPSIIVTSSSSALTSTSERLKSTLALLGNATLLERPIPIATLLSVARSALASRERQYSAESLLIDLENARQRAEEAIRARDEFLSIASHELKTPITSLKIHLQMTNKKIDLDQQVSPPLDKLKKVFNISERQIKKLTSLIDDLLDVSKIHAGRLEYSFEQVDLSGIINDVLERFAETLAASSCPVTLNVPESIAGFWDRQRLEQVLVNLLTNIIKYAPGSEVRITALQGPIYVHFEVQDFGPGISKEKQTAIFEKFERVDAQKGISGMGLGLYIVKQIVEGHQGTVEIESSPGNGCKFKILLPLDFRSLLNAPQVQAV